MNRRGFLRAGLAALALTTGLARAHVGLVDDELVWLVPIRSIGIDQLRREYEQMLREVYDVTGLATVRVLRAPLEEFSVGPLVK